MKKLFLFVLLVPILSLAQTPFDGTWVTKLDTARFPTKPDVYSLKDGMYDCLTCVPKVSVKADGTDQKVTGHPYYDSVAARVVNASTVEIINKKAGKPIFTSTETVSADGNTLTDKFMDESEDKPVTGEAISTRVDKGPAGSHAISGSWRTQKVNDVSNNGLTNIYQSTADGLKWSDPNGASYDAKFDGKYYPIEGDPGHTMVSLKRINANTIVETDKRDGKIVGVSHMTVSADGKTMDVRYESKLYGTTMSIKAEKQ